MNKPLPVKGYTNQPSWKIEMVNQIKETEETILRALDLMKDDEETKDQIDQRWLAIGRTQLEQAFMAINRSVFRPTRFKLEGDV